MITGSGWRRGGGACGADDGGPRLREAGTDAGRRVLRCEASGVLRIPSVPYYDGSLLRQLRRTRQRSSRRLRRGTATRKRGVGPDRNRRDAKSATGRKARSRGTPGSRCFTKEWFRGVPRHPLPSPTRAERTARAMTHVHCHPRPERRRRAGEGDPEAPARVGLDPLPSLRSPGMTNRNRVAKADVERHCGTTGGHT